MPHFIHDTGTKLHLTDGKYLNKKGRESNRKGAKLNKEEDITIRGIYIKKRRISRIIESNVKEDNFMFVTLTLDKQKVVSRYDLVELKKNWELFVKRMRYRFPDFQYVCVPETHKDGAWHLHFISLGIKDKSINFNELREEIWGLGRVDVTYDIPIYKAGYLAKYIGKFRNSDGITENYKKGDRIVWTSRGLNKGIKQIIDTNPDRMSLKKLFSDVVINNNSIEFLELLAAALMCGYEIEHDTGLIESEDCPINRYVRLINKGGGCFL